MANQQCGLCLSCGAPFLPNSKQVSFYNRKGNLSVLYINDEYENDRELRALFHVPKFSDPREGAHIFHRSHHQTAIDYMCNHHRNDDAPEWTASGKLREFNGPLPYLNAPTAVKDGTRGPSVAVWDRPSKADRLDFGDLLELIVDLASHKDRHHYDARRPQSIDITYQMCKGCNAIMTATANMRFLIGFTAGSERNSNGSIIERDLKPIRCRTADANGNGLLFAFRSWTFDPGEHEEEHPNYTKDDIMDPHVAYYLHLCLPFLDAPSDNPFNTTDMPGTVRTARSLYLELSWVILEIACIATLIDKGHLYDKGSRSHGMAQHWGALDIYVSFFVWRLCEFHHRKAIHKSGLDFPQWHQKYFCEAIHCPALYPGRILPNTTIGQLVCPATDMNSRDLVETICTNLVELYSHTLENLRWFVTANPPAPPLSDEWLFVTKYFLPLDTMRLLRQLGGTQVSLPFSVSNLSNLLSFFEFTEMARRAAQGQRLRVGARGLRRPRAPLPRHPPQPK